MMTALEQEIIEKINQLDPEARSRVITYIQNIALAPFDYETWRKEVDEFRQKLQEEIGEGNTIGGLEILRELREED